MKVSAVITYHRLTKDLLGQTHFCSHVNIIPILNLFQDVLEELLQDDVHDELDVKDRDRAALRLTKWASHRLIVRRKNASMRNRDESLGKSPPKERRSGIGVDIEQGFSNEESPLLKNKNIYFK